MSSEAWGYRRILLYYLKLKTGTDLALTTKKKLAHNQNFLCFEKIGFCLLPGKIGFCLFLSFFVVVMYIKKKFIKLFSITTCHI